MGRPGEHRNAHAINAAHQHHGSILVFRDQFGYVNLHLIVLRRKVAVLVLQVLHARHDARNILNHLGKKISGLRRPVSVQEAAITSNDFEPPNGRLGRHKFMDLDAIV